MFNYLTTSMVTIGYSTLTLYLLSLLAIVSAVFVIVSKNPVVSVLFLIGLFFLIAFFLILIDVDFIGISYILVYVGAVSILFLFILMLINIRVSELLSNSENSILLLSLVGLFSIGTISPIIPNEFNKLLELFNNIIFHVNHNSWETNVSAISNISSLGNIMYSTYSILLLIASLILLLAMVGAIVITIKPKNLYSEVSNITSLKSDIWSIIVLVSPDSISINIPYDIAGITIDKGLACFKYILNMITYSTIANTDFYINGSFIISDNVSHPDNLVLNNTKLDVKAVIDSFSYHDKQIQYISTWKDVNKHLYPLKEFSNNLLYDKDYNFIRH